MNTAHSPLKTFLYLWVGSLLLLISGVITYHDVKLYSAGLLYIFVCISAFSAGYCIAMRFRFGARKKHDYVLEITWREDLQRYRNIVSAFAICGIISAALFSVEMYNAGVFNTSDLGMVREIFMRKETTIYGQLAAILGAGGFFALVSVIIYWELLPVSLRFLWVASPVLLSLFSVLSGGRQVVLQLILFTFFSYRLKKKIVNMPTKKSLFARGVLAFLVLAIISYGFLAGSQRGSQQVNFNKTNYVVRLFEVSLNPVVEKVINVLPGFISEGVTEGLIYFTHTIPNLIYFIGMDNKPGPYGGLWEAPFITRRLNNLGLVDTSFDNIADAVVSHYAASGRFALIWQTWIRDMIVDFTMFGTVCVLFAIGGVIGGVVRSYEKKGGLVLAFLVVGFNLAAVYSLMFSPVVDTFILFYFIICFVLLVFKGFKLSSRLLSVENSQVVYPGRS